MNNKETKYTSYIIIWAITIIIFIIIAFSTQISSFIRKINNKSKTTITKVDNNNKITNNKTVTNTVDNNNKITNNEDKIKITIIDDKRCINCNTKSIVFQLKEVSTLNNAIFETKDFSNTGVAEMLKENNIKNLPAILFSSNKVDPWLSKFLEKINNWNFLLKTWSNFNPFIKRSDKWFLLIDQKDLDSIKKDVYIKWNTNAKITWLEYSDLECPFCAKLHNSDVSKTLEDKYWENLNKIFNHFPLEFHKNALPWAQVLECLWEQKGANAFYSLIKKSFWDKNSKKDFLIKEALKLWANKASLNSCIDNNKYMKKISFQSKRWSDLFWITGTPWNILINNDTLEYGIISWAYPKEAFIKLIDRLLQK